MNTAALLIDSNNVACRASFVSPHDYIVNNNFTILDGMIQSKVRLLESQGYGDIRTCYMFDEPACSYIDFHPTILRDDLIGEYKGTRDGIENIEVRQRDCWIQAWAQSLFNDNENVLSYPGAEADDYLGYCSQRLSTDGINATDVFIWSMDKDILQCVSDDRRVSVIRRRAHEAHDGIFHEHDVIAEKHVPASKIRLQLTLQGDSADNYKGIRGYGGKRGIELLNSSESLDDIVNMFPNDRDMLMRNWRLAGIGRDYLDDNALKRADQSLAILTGPEF